MVLDAVKKRSYLEIEGLITIEDQDKAPQLMAKGFDGLCLPSPSRSCYLKEKQSSPLPNW